jgi:hypothetical protein
MSAKFSSALCLVDLKKLELRSKHMTDLTIFYGILDCKKLTSLTLMAYGVSIIK